MSVLLLKKAVEAVQRYFADVQRFNSYRQLPLNEATLRMIRRDLGIAEPADAEAQSAPAPAVVAEPVSPAVAAGGSYAAVRSGNGAPRRRHLPIRLNRARSGA